MPAGERGFFRAEPRQQVVHARGRVRRQLRGRGLRLLRFLLLLRPCPPLLLRRGVGVVARVCVRRRGRALVPPARQQPPPEPARREAPDRVGRAPQRGGGVLLLLLIQRGELQLQAGVHLLAQRPRHEHVLAGALQQGEEDGAERDVERGERRLEPAKGHLKLFKG